MNEASEAPPLQHADVSNLDLQAWRERLLRSVFEPVQAGRRFPGFPEESVQRAFVGSAHADALEEGFRFYAYVQAHMDRHSGRAKAGRYLDFGCGWGRISRFFLRDFERGDMAGVDVDPVMTTFCQDSAQPGGYFTIGNRERLPFADGAFKLVTAYSVFTHLPPPLFQLWMDELLRVTTRGGLIVFTTEPERFLDFVAGIDRVAPESGWHDALAQALGEIETRRAALRRDGVVYLPTGGGPYRAPDVYGDTVVTQDYVARSVRGRGRLLDYLDDPGLFWQAVSVVRRVG